MTFETYLRKFVRRNAHTYYYKCSYMLLQMSIRTITNVHCTITNDHKYCYKCSYVLL